jgi:flagellar biosynthetic protein FliQ
MTPESVVQIIRQALLMAFWLGAPLLAVGFVAGIVMSLIQITTSIQDSAFATVPRLLAFLAALLFFLPWLLRQSMSYTVAILGELQRYAR